MYNVTRHYIHKPNLRPLPPLQVQPGPPPCPVFHPERTELPLPPDGLWVLRFPYAYTTERGPCYPPKENQPLSAYKVLRGILRAASVSPPPPPPPQLLNC